MTTADRRQKRVSIDDQVRGVVTGEEYRRALIWSQCWKWALLGVLLLFVYQTARVGYVVAVQLVTQTSLVRPLTPQQRRDLSNWRGRGVTLDTTAQMRPDGWVVKLPAALERCGRVPTCFPAVNSYARFLLRTAPEAISGVENIQKIGGALVVVMVFALFAVGEAQTWPAWERREMTAQTRRKSKTRR